MNLSDCLRSQDQENVYADGGVVNNVAMIGLIRRGCTTIVACFNTEKPLQTNNTWDPSTQPPTSARIDGGIPNYFGIHLEQLGQDEHRNQVFPKADFPRVAVALQRAQAEGDGMVVTTRHTTVANSWWGIAKGIDVKCVGRKPALDFQLDFQGDL